MTNEVRPEAFAQVARDFLALHGDNWDALHIFAPLFPDGDGGLKTPVVSAIDPSFPPEMYPVIMLTQARAAIGHENQVPAGLVLQVEAYSSAVSRDASQEEKEQLERDGRNRAIRDRADAREICEVVAVDAEGGTWQAMKFRDTGEVTEDYFAPDQEGDLGGRFPESMRMIMAALAGGIVDAERPVH